MPHVNLCFLIYSQGDNSHRTLVPIQYPPHTVALGSLYVAALLSSFEQPTSPHRPGYRSSHEIAVTLSKRGEWQDKFQVKIADLEGKPLPM